MKGNPISEQEMGFFIDLIAENLLISPHKCLRHHEKMA